MSVSFFRWGSLIPLKVTFQGLGGLLKSKLALCLWVFSHIGLKTVGKAVGISDLEFYQARHTFATLSRNLMKFSKGDVDEALNHVGSFEVADIYIAKDFSIINDNNFKLIKRVFKK